MCEFGNILKYEYLKLFHRKIIWITLGIMMILSVVIVFVSDVGFDSEEPGIVQYIRKNKQEEMEIVGEKVDDRMLEKYRDKECAQGLWYFLNCLFPSDYICEVTEEKLYQQRQELLQNNMEEARLTKGEKAYWKQKEAGIEKPFTYGYTAGERKLTAVFYTLAMMQVIFIAVTVPSIFADEHFRKMDQLNLCSKYGKGRLYGAKITAGLTVGTGGTLCLILSSVIPILILYGFHGLDVRIQLIYAACSYHLTIGQVIRNQIILLIFASVLESAFAMFCAEKMKSGMGTMAVMTGILLLSLTLNIPEQFRMAVQLWNSIPSNILAVWNLLDCRLVSLFGRYFTQMQFLPIVYVILAFLLAAGGWREYKRYQITK
ncbi:hypothetical protein [Blautia sp.]|uniref:hypothetical protein n=1 Tax=Blautia sp. TaxID=1955243 RepID=UPI003AB1CD76